MERWGGGRSKGQRMGCSELLFRAFATQKPCPTVEITVVNQRPDRFFVLKYYRIHALNISNDYVKDALASIMTDITQRRGKKFSAHAQIRRLSLHSRQARATVIRNICECLL